MTSPSNLNQSGERKLRDQLRALPRTDRLDPRYPIDAYEDDLVKLIHQRELEARIDELSYWESAIKYPILDNLSRLKVRISNRIEQLSKQKGRS